MTVLVDSLGRFAAQATLFAPRPNRLALQRLSFAGPATRRVSVNVWRNHAIEPIVALSQPYSAFSGMEMEFNLGPYDDSLSFDSLHPADAELLWLDGSRYLARMPLNEWFEWLRERLEALRARTPRPIVIATWLDERDKSPALHALSTEIPGCFFADIGALCDEIEVPVVDRRTASVAGTPLAGTNHALLARKLACHWLPAALFAPIKAVAVDLDQTLYAGVLGEDGIEGIRLTPAHRELQEFLCDLRSKGVFLALVSRNEARDVEELFARRQDFPLRAEDFSAMKVSWQEKADALDDVARALRISADALLYLDDNPGELAAIAGRLPQVALVHASSDASVAKRTIEYFPGIWRWRYGAEDGQRVADLAANEVRQNLLAESGSEDNYFRSLKIELTFEYRAEGQLTRLTELSAKTNQFNLALRRFTLAELAALMKRSDACVASVHLNDRLSESGIIAMIAAECEGDRLRVEELCISCRALGRRLEDAMVFLALRHMPIFEGCNEVVFRVARGERNGPALDWLSRCAGFGSRPEPGLIALPAEALSNWRVPEGIAVEFRERE